MSSLPARRPQEDEFILTHTVDAPRALAFGAWVDCDLFTRWWGPRGFSIPFCSINARPGGLLHYAMRAPDGKEYWARGIYLEVVRREYLSWIDSFSDHQGHLVWPEDVGMSAVWPVESLVEVTFSDFGERTVVTLHSHVSPDTIEAQDAMQGWAESFEKLDELLDELAREARH